MKTLKKSISITLDEDIIYEMRNIADSHSSSISFIINRFLRIYLNKFHTESNKE